MSQGTRVFRSREATMLLGIDGLAVVSVVEVDGVRQVHAVTDDPTAAACPACGVISDAVKGQVVSSPRDLPYGPAPIRLVWHKRRWRCREPRCERASFTESIPAIPARSRLTSRLRAECGEGIAERFTCVASAAAHYGCRGGPRTPPTSATSRRRWRRRCRRSPCSALMRSVAGGSAGSRTQILSGG